MYIPEEIQRKILAFLPMEGFNAAWNVSGFWRKFLQENVDKYVHYQIMTISEDNRCVVCGLLPNNIQHGLEIWWLYGIFEIRWFKIGKEIEKLNYQPCGCTIKKAYVKLTFEKWDHYWSYYIDKLGIYFKNRQVVPLHIFKSFTKPNIDLSGYFL